MTEGLPGPNHSIIKRSYVPLVLMIAGFFPTFVNADPLQLSAGVQERYSDNVRLTSHNKKSDLQTRTYVSFSQQSTPGNCQSSLGGQVGYSSYLNGTYSNQTDANANWDGSCLIGHGFSWVALDNISQVPTDSSQPDTPSNSNRRNIFSTGPSWSWRINPTNFLSLSSKYENTDFSDPTQRDSHRIKSDANLTHLVDDTLSVSVGGNTSDTKYDDGEKLRSRGANVGLTKSFATTRVSVTAGYTSLDDVLDGNTSNFGGVTWSANITRNITENSQWYFSYSRDYTDTSSSYVLTIAGLNFNYRQTSAVRVTSYRTGYTNNWSDGSTLGIRLGRDESYYLLTSSKDTTDSVDVSLSRPLAAQWTATTGVIYERQSFGLQDTKNDTYNAYIGTQYQRTQALSFTGRIGHNLRHSSDSTAGYAENFVLVGLRYAFR